MESELKKCFHFSVAIGDKDLWKHKNECQRICFFSKGSVETNDNCTVKIKAAGVRGNISSSRFGTRDVVQKSGL